MTRLRRLPARVRFALISAGLTFAILGLFATAVAVFDARQVRKSFDNEVKGSAADLQQTLVRPSLKGPEVYNDPHAVRAAAAHGGVIWVLLPRHSPISTPHAPSLGPPRFGIRNVDDYRVAARPVRSPGGVTVGAFQYGRPLDGVRHTLTRMRVLLAAGLLAGTALAFLAAWALARRPTTPMAA